MIKQLQALYQEVQNDPIDKTGLLIKIKTADDSLFNELKMGGKLEIFDRKWNVVPHIKKYDVVHAKTFGSVHFLLVYKVVGDLVYGVVFTSVETDNCIHQTKKDRINMDMWATTTISTTPLTDALSKFSRVYENKREADEIFKKVKLHYKKLLTL